MLLQRISGPKTGVGPEDMASAVDQWRQRICFWSIAASRVFGIVGGGLLGFAENPATMQPVRSRQVFLSVLNVKEIPCEL